MAQLELFERTAPAPGIESIKVGDADFLATIFQLNQSGRRVVALDVIGQSSWRFWSLPSSCQVSR